MRIIIIAPFVEPKIYEAYQKAENQFNPGQKFYALLHSGICENGIPTAVYSLIGSQYKKYTSSVSDDRFRYFYVRDRLERKSIAAEIANEICDRIDPRHDIILADGEAYWTMRAAIMCRKQCGCKILELITDFPHHVYSYSQESFHDNPVVKTLRFTNAYYKLLDMRKADGYILLTEGMTDIVGRKKPYVVVEGFSQKNLLQGRDSQDTKFIAGKNIVYAGSLNGQSGISDFADAFLSLSRNDYTLTVYGAGEGREKIEKLQELSNRIRYGGVISVSDIAVVERKAALLVNPRPSAGGYNRYSFPSKTLEYLSSGTPMMSTRLEGIPDDYQPYIYWLDDSSPEAMRKSLESVLNLPAAELRKMGSVAKEYALTYKSPKNQAEKILQLARRMVDG